MCHATKCKSTLINAIIQKHRRQGYITTSRNDSLKSTFGVCKQAFMMHCIVHRHQMAQLSFWRNSNSTPVPKRTNPKTSSASIQSKTLFCISRFHFCGRDSKASAIYHEPKPVSICVVKVMVLMTNMSAVLVPPVGKEKEEFPALVKHDIVFLRFGLDLRHYPA